MSKTNKLSARFAEIIAAIALLMGIVSVNSTCYCWYHQPKVPQGMQRFKK